MADITDPTLKVDFSMVQLAALIESLPAAVACHGGEELLLVNQAMCELTGHTRQRLLSMKFWELIQPRMRDSFRQRGLSRLCGSAEPNRYEVALLTAQGEERLADMVASVLDVSGKKINHGTYLDITERRASERALQEYARYTQVILDNAIDGIITIDERGTVRSFNRAAEQIFGYLADEVIGNNINMLMPEPYHSEHDRYLENYRSTGVPHIIGIGLEVVGMRKDGKTFPMGLAVSQGTHEGKPIFIGLIRDITERRRAESQQMEAQQLLAQIIDSNPVPTFVIDRNHLITHWNRACEEVIGLKAADMVGTQRHQKVFYGRERPAMADLIVDGGNVTRIKDLYNDKRLTRSPLIAGAYEAEDFFPTIGGGGTWLYFSAAPLTDREGNLIGAVETLQNFTERRFAESELIKSKRELEHLAATRGEQLRAATHELEQDIARRQEIETELMQRLNELSALNAEVQHTQQQLVQSEKLASIGQLAAGVAHEINNPIGFVQSNLASLERYFQRIMNLLEGYREGEVLLGGLAASHAGGAALLEQIKKLKKEAELDYLKTDIPLLLQESKEGIARVRKIVTDLRDFSRIDSNQEWEWADLRTGLDSTLNIVSNEIRYRADVVKNYGELPQIKCLSSQLNQVFMNLLVNAAQAMPEGRHGTITIRCGTAADGVWIEIADTGEGIAPEKLTHIFDPFFTTKPVGKGTGLGLSLSYGIVQKHSGHIDVRSEVGVGTSFRISLPLEPPEIS